MKKIIIILLFLSLISCSKEKPIKTVVKEVENKELVEKKEKVEEIKEFKYRIDPDNYMVYPLNNASKKVLLLTIDDAPKKHSLDMAKYLKSKGYSAIFFVNAHFLTKEEEKNTLKEIHNMGFEIGNHTMGHPNLKKLSYKEKEREILGLNKIIKDLIGKKPRFLRPPFGAFDDEVLEICKKEKMMVINWSFGYDWMQKYQDSKKLTKIMLETKYLQNGSNILLHDLAWTSDALKDIIEGYEKKGYEIVNPKEIKTIFDDMK